MLPKHIPALKALRGFRLDSAFEDEFAHIPITSRAFSAALDAANVPHTFEMYNGDHRNRLWGREGRLFAEVLPFVSRVFDSAPTDVAVQERLWDAAAAGQLPAVISAHDAGADVNAIDTRTNTNGRRPLNYAAERGDVAMIRWLVEHGADVNRPNVSGFTPLHHAAESGSLPAVEALLAVGADRGAKLPSGRTPLDVARQRGHLAVVRLLERMQDTHV
jgi:hypothetical protein